MFVVMLIVRMFRGHSNHFQRSYGILGKCIALEMQF